MRTVTTSALLLFAAAPVVAAPAPFTKPERPGRTSELNRLQGEWLQETVYHWRDGGWEEILSRLSIDVRIQGNRFVSSNAVEYFSLHGKTPPRGIDVASDLTVLPTRGVYSIEGDTLTIVLARYREERPTSLDKGQIKVVYHRKKP